MAGVSEVRKNLRRIRKFCGLSTDKASADLEAMCADDILWKQLHGVLVCYISDDVIKKLSGCTSISLSVHELIEIPS